VRWNRFYSNPGSGFVTLNRFHSNRFSCFGPVPFVSRFRIGYFEPVPFESRFRIGYFEPVPFESGLVVLNRFHSNNNLRLGLPSSLRLPSCCTVRKKSPRKVGMTLYRNSYLTRRQSRMRTVAFACVGREPWSDRNHPPLVNENKGTCDSDPSE